jgi:hypothetical protein
LPSFNIMLYIFLENTLKQLFSNYNSVDAENHLKYQWFTLGLQLKLPGQPFPISHLLM